MVKFCWSLFLMLRIAIRHPLQAMQSSAVELGRSTLGLRSLLRARSWSRVRDSVETKGLWVPAGVSSTKRSGFDDKKLLISETIMSFTSEMLLSLAAPTSWWSGARSGWSSESSAFHSDWDRWGTLNLIFASSLVWCGEVLLLLESILAVEREAGHNMMVCMWWQYVQGFL